MGNCFLLGLFFARKKFFLIRLDLGSYLLVDNLEKNMFFKFGQSDYVISRKSLN